MADVALTGRARGVGGSAALVRRDGAPRKLDPLLRELDAQLRAAGTPRRAAHDKAYLKSDLTFYGATVPEIRPVVVCADASAAAAIQNPAIRASSCPDILFIALPLLHANDRFSRRVVSKLRDL